MSRLPNALRSLALLLLFLAAPLAADVHPNTAGGFPTDKAFTVGEIDNVNLFNGALTLTIPLGQSYPVNAGFSYKLQLVYNANPWDFEQVTAFDPQQSRDRDFTAAYPTRCSNAGFGWRLSLGQMNPPCQNVEVFAEERPVYQDETGTDHVFYKRLHTTQPNETPEPEDANFFYTRDGSYLRLKKLVSGLGLLQGWEIHFPDGTVREHNALGRLTKIRDPFNNYLDVAYSNVSGAEVWTLTDSLNRMHKVQFTTAYANQGYPQLVESVELQTFGAARSTYRFVYEALEIGRACPHDYSRGDLTGALSVGVSVPLLTSVTQPDGSVYSMKSAYVADVAPAAPDTDLGAVRCTDHAGNLLSLRLPTGGTYRWTWQTYRFPTGSATKKHAQRNSGVATRSVFDFGPIPGSLLGTWQYLRPEFPLAGNEVMNTVIDPLGHKTERYFVTQLAGAAGSGDKHDYGLPFTGDVGNASRRRVGSNGATLFLASRVFENVGGSAVLRRSEYVRYERDETYSALQPDQTNTNRRMAQSLTVYEDDPGRTAEVIQSDFDGLGHYRQALEVNGGFLGSANRKKTAAHNPARGTFAINIATNTQVLGVHGFKMLPASADWQLERPASFRTDQTAPGGATESEMTELCYAANAPVVVRQRTHRLDGAAQDAADLLTVRSLSAAGNVSTESFYGGDSQRSLATGASDLCFLTPPASALYQLNHTYSGGVRATSRYQGFTFFSLNQTIDASTGLPSVSRDASDLATTYGYDAFGRVLRARPEAGQGAWTEIQYFPVAFPSTPAFVTIERRNNLVTTGSPLTKDVTEFDGLGRVVKELQLLPSGANARRNTAYDGAGNRKSVTEWFLATGSPNGTTVFEGYDPFGRPGKITPPDGAAHAVTLNYIGARQVARSVSVATTAGGAETSTSVTETYDRFGRLAKLDEGSGAGGAAVSTFYGYDVGNRLTSVSTSSAGVTQDRTFTYDRAGLLKSETHPEKGTTTYASYDAKGHLLRKQEGTTDLTYAFDKAERLIQIRESLGVQRTLKSFTYADANGNFIDPINGSTCPDKRQGKLTQQSRFNFVTIFGSPYTVEIREGMAYCGRDGRLSRKSLENRVNGAVTPNESFVWPSWSYDSLGNVTTFSYPQCTHAACTALSPRTVQNSYTNGGLTQVGFPGSPGAYANSITYLPNGMVNQVVHANTPSIPSTWLTDTYAPDPKGMNRPASMTTTTSTGAQRWATGTYAYDGAGNVKAIGSHTFGYDRVSRLTAANLYLEPTASTSLRSQTYSYDAFGNLLGIAGSNGRSIPVSSATNRLAPPPLNPALIQYDTKGNLTAWNGSAYDYDPFNLMWRYKTATAGDEWIYLYTADDERVWSYKADNTSLWTLRDAGAGVLREYSSAGSWQVQSDYIYRGSQLLAAETPGGLRHFHLDHLGTPRLVSNSGGFQTAYHVYYPYGEEATAFNQDTIRAKFTGHERDLANPGGPGDDLDYMHARHYSPLTGRFVQVDPTQASAKPNRPQSWNRYSYALNNPINIFDLDGQAWDYVLDAAGLAYDAYQLYKEPSVGNGLTLVADIGLAVVPFVPTKGGVALAAKAGRGGLLLLENAARGRTFERAVLGALDAAKNTSKVAVEGLGKAIPDVLAGAITEIKSGAELSNTLQLRVMAAVARIRGVPFNLIVGPETKVISGPLQRSVERTGGQIVVYNPATNSFSLFQPK